MTKKGNSMENYKRKTQFIDANNNLATLEIEFDKNINHNFTICADYCNNAGQCLRDIYPRTKEQKLLINIWKKYHLQKNYPQNLESIVERLCDLIN